MSDLPAGFHVRSSNRGPLFPLKHRKPALSIARDELQYIRRSKDQEAERPYLDVCGTIYGSEEE